MRLQDLVLDTWASLSHKQPMKGAQSRMLVGGDWMPEPDRRRLTAYLVLKAYEENVSRVFLQVNDDDSSTEDHREYGDAALVVQQTLSAVLGDEQHIRVDGAEDTGDPDQEPDPAAIATQEFLQEWAERERLPLKMMEVEQDAVTLGDGVYVLAWDERKQRVRLRTMDPGFYFPVLDDDLDDDYPRRIHFAWELEGDPLRGVPRRLRRITYELAPISYATTVEPSSRGLLRRVVSWGSAETRPEPTLIPGDTFAADGRIVRQLPWNDEPTEWTCYLTDATWNLDDLDARDGLNDLSLANATYGYDQNGELLDRLDLRIDFLPVVHLPNTVALRPHFGTSSLSKVLQLLDDISATDTDLQAASSTAGSPPIGLSGATVPTDANGRADVTIGPGEVWNLGPDGSLSTVDTSPALEALGARVEALLSRLSANSRLPEAVLGRVSPADVPSGFAVALTFGPMQSMIRSMRLSRGEKYPLLLKFVLRLSMLGGVLPDGAQELPTELTFGSYLPADLDGVISRVTALLGANAISLETAVLMLQEAGVPIEDPAAEVDRIQSRAFAQANELADATGDQEAVRAYLGMKGPAPELPPAPVTLPAPPAAAQPVQEPPAEE